MSTAEIILNVCLLNNSFISPKTSPLDNACNCALKNTTVIIKYRNIFRQVSTDQMPNTTINLKSDHFQWGSTVLCFTATFLECLTSKACKILIMSWKCTTPWVNAVKEYLLEPLRWWSRKKISFDASVMTETRDQPEKEQC